VARYGGDLGYGASRQSQPRDGGPAQVVEVQVFVAEPARLNALSTMSGSRRWSTAHQGISQDYPSGFSAAAESSAV